MIAHLGTSHAAVRSVGAGEHDRAPPRRYLATGPALVTRAGASSSSINSSGPAVLNRRATSGIETFPSASRAISR